MINESQNKLEENSGLEWQVVIKDDQVELSNYDKRWKRFLPSGFYNCSINVSLCPTCGYPKKSNLPGTECWREANHEKLVDADGVFQIGFYYNEKSKEKEKMDDKLSQHINNIGKDPKFVTPLALAMFEIAQTKYQELLEADLIIPIPSYYKNKKVLLKKADILAPELHKFFDNNGKGAKLVRCIKKTQNVEMQKLTWDSNMKPEEITVIINNAYKVSDNVNISGKKVLLVDNNLTTGLTAGICAKMLKAQGAEKVWVFVAGRTK